MTANEFYRAVTNGEQDAVATLLQLLRDTQADYCLIGGLAVNAYAEPVISLDLDLVVVAEKLQELANRAEQRGFRVETYARSINLTPLGSDIRIRLQTDERYQSFLHQAVERDVLGYRLLVAALEDVFQGKIWAYSDERRRKSKRQKDLADIARLVESHPELLSRLPRDLREQVN